MHPKAAQYKDSAIQISAVYCVTGIELRKNGYSENIRICMGFSKLDKQFVKMLNKYLYFRRNRYYAIHRIHQL